MERVRGRAVQKDLNELDKHDGVVSHPEPDLLECAVRWALGSPAVNKASGWDGIQVEIFKTLKDDAIKCCTQYVSKSGRPSSGHRTGKGQSSFQVQRRVVLKSVLTIRQVYSSPMIVRSCLKSCTLRFSIMQTKNFQMSKLGLEKGRRTRDQIANISGFERKQGNFRKSPMSVSSTMIKPLTV